MTQKDLVIQWIIQEYQTDRDGAIETLDDFFIELQQCTVLVDPNGKTHILYKEEGDETLTEY